MDEDASIGLLNETTLEDIGQRAVGGAVGGLEISDSSWRPSEQEKASLAKDVATSIEMLNIKSRIQDKDRIYGTLITAFASQAFNRDGSRLIVLPGVFPRSNDVDDAWVIGVWDTAKKEMKLTLKGHTDNVTWAGFSPDDIFIASVSFDRTFRIWSHVDETLLHTFHSNGQNWTGGFSPDSRLFAGTTVGQLWVWDVIHGIEMATQTWSGGWCRCLDWSPSGKQLVVGDGTRVSYLCLM